MKKFFLSILTFTLIFSSCSSNENIEDVEEAVIEIPKLVASGSNIRQNPHDEEDYTYIYDSDYFLKKISFFQSTYSDILYDSNNRIISENKIINGSVFSKSEYLYVGSNISKKSLTIDGKLTSIEEYSYENNKVSSIKRTYYTSNGTSLENFKIEYENLNNSVKKLSTDGTILFEEIFYDNKKNKHLNNEKYHPILKIELNSEYNNSVKKIKYYNTEVEYTSDYENKYDDEDFLIESKEITTYKSGNTTQFTTKFTYNK